MEGEMVVGNLFFICVVCVIFKFFFVGNEFLFFIIIIKFFIIGLCIIVVLIILKLGLKNSLVLENVLKFFVVI